MSQRKGDLISRFMTQKRSVKLQKNPTLEQMRERDLKIFKLSEKILLENPMLLDVDCSGIGLPSYSYVSLGNLNGFNMNSQLLVQLKKLDSLREYF